MLRTRLRPATAVAALAAGVIALLSVTAGAVHGTTPTTTTATGAPTFPAGNAQWG
ncbi:hypothetical protein ACFQ7B_39960 [Streptomyces erythrochromogenes]|uniref:hypothetical protein n=1 Tax=Streptomyces erythrochromogenes TaxID=285574 RepID=UPI0036BE058B